MGLDAKGCQIAHDGATGKPLEVSVFCGQVYYQRLKHMVNDKERCRTTGPMVNLTRQPASGRANEGGLRIGEMERDIFIAHGIAASAHERLFMASDAYSMHTCRRCGLNAIVNDGRKPATRAMPGFRTHKCNNCDNRTDFTIVRVPYAAKLWMQELMAVGIGTRMLA